MYCMSFFIVQDVSSALLLMCLLYSMCNMGSSVYEGYSCSTVIVYGKNNNDDLYQKRSACPRNSLSLLSQI